MLNLEFHILNSTSVLIQWSEPTVPNGIVIEYEVIICMTMMMDFKKVRLQRNSNLTVIHLGKTM